MEGLYRLYKKCLFLFWLHFNPGFSGKNYECDDDAAATYWEYFCKKQLMYNFL